MDLVRSFGMAVLLSLALSLSLHAQDRDLRGERLFLDDNSGEGVTLHAPHPMPDGASYSLTLPDSLPPGDFVLFGTSSGAMSALEPSAAFNTVSWLLSGNSLSDPANDFLGTTDSVDLAFRTNGLERMRIDALGNIGLGAAASASARLYVGRTFDDSVATEPLFGIPLAFGVRSQVNSPAVADSDAVYISSGNLMLVQGSNDMSAANSFVGNVGLTLNANTGGQVGDLAGLLGIVFQVDPGASTESLAGVRAQTEISGGTVTDAAGVSANVIVQDAAVSRASGIAVNLGVEGSDTVNEGYGVYVNSPYVDPNATLTRFTGLAIDNMNDSGQVAIHYNGSGSNAPFIVEGDGDVGIGDSTPDGRLDVENNDSSVPTVAVANNSADGLALQVAAGGFALSYGSGAPATIPVGTSVFNIDDGLGGLPPVVGVPTSGTDGQILYIYISDPEGAMIEGTVYATGDRLTYIRIAGAWQLFHVN